MEVNSDVGKYGRVWMHLLYEIDRMQYNQMMLDGTLFDTAILKNEIGYELLDRSLEESIITSWSKWIKCFYE